ncbi:hypothetical protein U1Q18_033007, partial [Sarracenia purpurea var. burkii]
FLFTLVGIYRYDGEEINARLAKSEATVLNNAINDKIFNHGAVIRIINTRSKARLIGTINRYKDDYNTSITKHLVNDLADQYLGCIAHSHPMRQ